MGNWGKLNLKKLGGIPHLQAGFELGFFLVVQAWGYYVANEVSSVLPGKLSQLRREHPSPLLCVKLQAFLPLYSFSKRGQSTANMGLCSPLPIWGACCPPRESRGCLLLLHAGWFCAGPDACTIWGGLFKKKNIKIQMQNNKHPSQDLRRPRRDPFE